MFCIFIKSYLQFLPFCNFCMIFCCCCFSQVTLYCKILYFPYITYLPVSISIYSVSWKPCILCFSFIVFSPHVSYYFFSSLILKYSPCLLYSLFLFLQFPLFSKYFMHFLYYVWSLFSLLSLVSVYSRSFVFFYIPYIS